MGNHFLRRPAWLLSAVFCLITMAKGAVTVEKIAYHGWPDAYKISNGTVQLIVTASVGPRIIFYGFVDGDNEFHEFAEQAGKMGGDEFHSYGGHRLWVAPENERTYFPDNTPIKVVQQGNTVRFIGKVETGGPVHSDLQREMDIELAPTGSKVTITHKISNHGKTATHMAPWALSVMQQNGRAILPLPPKAPWGKEHLLPANLLALWSYTDFTDPRWVLGKKYIQLKQDPNPTAEFKAQKIGLRDVQGWGAYYRNGHLFVKRVDFQPKANYPDFGCNLEIYTDPGFLELESVGPMRELAPGVTAVHVERWWLFKDVPAGEGDAWVDSAVLPKVEDAK